jgi:hypothetical protein
MPAGPAPLLERRESLVVDRGVQAVRKTASDEHADCASTDETPILRISIRRCGADTSAWRGRRCAGVTGRVMPGTRHRKMPRGANRYQAAGTRAEGGRRA